MGSVASLLYKQRAIGRLLEVISLTVNVSQVAAGLLGVRVVVPLPRTVPVPLAPMPTARTATKADTAFRQRL